MYNCNNYSVPTNTGHVRKMIENFDAVGKAKEKSKFGQDFQVESWNDLVKEFPILVEKLSYHGHVKALSKRFDEIETTFKVDTKPARFLNTVEKTIIFEKVPRLIRKFNVLAGTNPIIYPIYS